MPANLPEIQSQKQVIAVVLQQAYRPTRIWRTYRRRRPIELRSCRFAGPPSSEPDYSSTSGVYFVRPNQTASSVRTSLSQPVSMIAFDDIRTNNNEIYPDAYLSVIRNSRRFRLRPRRRPRAPLLLIQNRLPLLQLPQKLADDVPAEHYCEKPKAWHWGSRWLGSVDYESSLD